MGTVNLLHFTLPTVDGTSLHFTSTSTSTSTPIRRCARPAVRVLSLLAYIAISNIVRHTFNEVKAMVPKIAFNYDGTTYYLHTDFPTYFVLSLLEHCSILCRLLHI